MIEFDQDLIDLLREHGEDCPFPNSPHTLSPAATASLEHSHDVCATHHGGLIGDFSMMATSPDVAFVRPRTR